MRAECAIRGWVQMDVERPACAQRPTCAPKDGFPQLSSMHCTAFAREPIRLAKLLPKLSLTNNSATRWAGAEQPVPPQGHVQLPSEHAKVRTRRQGLLQLVGLVGVRDTQRVQVLGAADLELGHAVRLLYLDGPGVLPPGRQEEVLDLIDLLRLHIIGHPLSRLATRSQKSGRKTLTILKTAQARRERERATSAKCTVLGGLTYDHLYGARYTCIEALPQVCPWHPGMLAHPG